MRKHITDEEINRLYEEFETPEHVIRHCRAVACVAMVIADALNQHGHNLNVDLIRGAGLTHDIARARARHWDVMADKLADMGYPEESVLVRNHMSGAGYHDIKDVSEMDMIWLGDRLVKEDLYVGIDERFEYIVEKARKMGVKDSQIDEIYESKAEMKHLMDQIEEEIGQSIDNLFADQ